MNIEKIVLKNLLQNEPYARKALPFLKEEYFQSPDDKALYVIVRDFILNFNALPSYDALGIEVNQKKGLTEEIQKGIAETINEFQQHPDKPNLDWLAIS